jgi:aryl-alcohol dehydrogenase-like predicted oxidoreductase
MDFLHREVAGRQVFRLGLAANFGIPEADIERAIERGVNYLYLTWRGKLARPLRAALQRRRDQIVVATGTMLGWTGGSVRRAAEKALRRLGVEQLDVFLVHWVGVIGALTTATERELVHLRESGKVRALGVSIHDRARAGRLAEDSPLDLLMIRYNMAHPGAERDIFPHLARRHPSVVAYTATRWRKLLARPAGWTGPVPSAGDCYRWCLSSPHVDVVLCGPADGKQLDENLAALARGPVTAEEDAWMRDLGRVVHG